MKRLPMLPVIDVEPDDHLLARDGSASVVGIAQTITFMTALREWLVPRSGLPVRFSWCIRFDPQIALTFGSPTFLFDRHEAAFSRLLDLGDEIGVHTHFYRWDKVANRWIIDHGDPTWVEQCIESSLDAYESVFGQPARIHRGGDFFTNAASVATLERRGVRFDLTIEPGHHLQEPLHPTLTTGVRPDHRRAPRTVYLPSRCDVLTPDPSAARSIRIVPMSSVRGPGRRRRFQGRLAGHPIARYRPHSLWRPGPSPSEYWDQAERGCAELANPYFATAVRSDALLPGTTAAIVRPRLEALVTHPISVRARFTTPSEWLGSA